MSLRKKAKGFCALFAHFSFQNFADAHFQVKDNPHYCYNKNNNNGKSKEK